MKKFKENKIKEREKKQRNKKTRNTGNDTDSDKEEDFCTVWLESHSRFGCSAVGSPDLLHL